MATVSALLTSKMSILPNPFSLTTTKPLNNLKVPNNSSSSSLGMVIECSSRPQKKATAHHRKTRPKKSAPWDIRRGPTVYPPLPQMPSEWSFVVEENVVVEGEESGGTKEATVAETV